MAERKRSKAEERAYAELQDALLELDDAAAGDAARLRAAAVREHARRVALRSRPACRCGRARCGSTAAYDEDVAKFFRTMGQGYQARMNAVLRAYMLAILSRALAEQEERGLDGAGDLRRDVSD